MSSWATALHRGNDYGASDREQVLPQGSVAISAVLSVLASTIALATLRATRPSRTSAWRRPGQVYLSRLMGALGALLLFVGQALSSLPWLLGVWTEDDGKFASIIQCTLVLTCWAIGWLLPGEGIADHVTSAGCALVWFGSTLVEWAGPRPYDSMMVGLRGQIAGCDGGYRTPFLIYAPVWLTGLTFGSLILVCSQMSCGGYDSDYDAEHMVDRSMSFASSCGKAPARLRKRLQRNRYLRLRLLPIVYGLATSMSCLALASGAALNALGGVAFGACLIAIAVLCAWHGLWSLELPVALWGLLSQNFSTLLRLVQGHLVFRDFRWSPELEQGFFVVWKWPGVWFFLLGFHLIVAVAVIFMLAPEREEAAEEYRGEDGKHDHIEESHMPAKSRRPIGPSRPLVRMVQWALFAAWLIFFYLGVTRTILDFQYGLPEVQWISSNEPLKPVDYATDAAGEASAETVRRTAGKSYVQLITALYDKRLPCSAMVIAFNTVVRAPLQFLTFLAVKLQPPFLQVDLLPFLQGTFLIGQAPNWFANVFVLILLVASFNLTGPTGVTELHLYLGSGFWYFLIYATISLLVGLTFQLFPETGALSSSSDPGPAAELQLDAEHEADDEASSSDQEDASLLSTQSHGGVPLMFIFVIAVLVVLIAVSLYVGLTKPFLNFDYRISGVVVRRAEPALYELFETIGDTYAFLQSLAYVTIMGMFVVWVPLLVYNIVLASKGFERGIFEVFELLARPWVLVDLWATAPFVLYYIFTSRNKAPVEVCAHLPENPVGLAAIGVLLVASKGIKYIAGIAFPRSKAERGSRLIRLPGGNVVWAMAACATLAAWSMVLYFHGPPAQPDIRDRETMNYAMSAMDQTFNVQMQHKLPHSAGDCNAYWASRVQEGKELYGDMAAYKVFMKGCRGTKPLARVAEGSTSVEASWATGLNSLQVTGAKLNRPVNVSAVAQRWSLALSGMFTDLHIHMKVDLNGKPWVNDYMCCSGAFHFAILASATCIRGRGFGGVDLTVTQVDRIEFQHQVAVSNLPDDKTSYQVDYGSSDAVEKAIRKFLTLKNGQLIMKNADGSVIDALRFAGNTLKEIFLTNTGHHCPHAD
eukprot:TRINITY_DN11678_c0_g1_i2.p1 TRINITY_DN11678_c0_g1~~TRINITY_DN11678_c0_g1_i2.p1  ORF type:complete len:1096 (-),score=179.93 TRINITY_DN11678_c0_g1_i2:128-3415(-)